MLALLFGIEQHDDGEASSTARSLPITGWHVVCFPHLFDFLLFYQSMFISQWNLLADHQYLDGRTSRSTGSRGIKGKMGTAAVAMARRRKLGSGENEGMLLLRLIPSIGERGRWEEGKVG